MDASPLKKENHDSHLGSSRRKVYRKVALAIGLVVGISLIFWMQHDTNVTKKSSESQLASVSNQGLDKPQKANPEGTSLTALGMLASQVIAQAAGPVAKEAKMNAHSQKGTSDIDAVTKQEMFPLFMVKSFAFECLKERLQEGRPYKKILLKIEPLFSSSQKDAFQILYSYADTRINPSSEEAKGEEKEGGNHTWADALKPWIQIHHKGKKETFLSFQGSAFDSNYQRLPVAVLEAMDSLETEVLDMGVNISEGLLYDAEKYVPNS